MAGDSQAESRCDHKIGIVSNNNTPAGDIRINSRPVLISLKYDHICICIRNYIAAPIGRIHPISIIISYPGSKKLQCLCTAGNCIGSICRNTPVLVSSQACGWIGKCKCSSGNPGVNTVIGKVLETSSIICLPSVCITASCWLNTERSGIYRGTNSIISSF